MNTIYIVSWNGMSIAGGVERVVKYIHDVLSERYDVIIVNDDLLRGKKLWKHWLVDNKLIKSIGYSIYAALHKQKGDYIISNGFQAPFVKADYLWVHGAMLENCRCVEKRTYYKATVESVLEMIGAHAAKRVVCVAGHVKAEYDRLYHVSSRKMKVLPNPVDCALFYPVSERAERSDRITILYMGRLETRKGIRELLHLSSYIETIHGYRLMIVTQSERDRTRLFSNRRHTRVFSKIAIEKLNDYYNRADVLYLPSRYEGFEMVTLESLSAGVPVVGYRVGAIDELSRGGQAGVCVLRDSTVETALSQLTEMAEKYKGKEARRALHEDVRRRYDIGAFKKRLQNELKLL